MESKNHLNGSSNNDEEIENHNHLNSRTRLKIKQPKDETITMEAEENTSHNQIHDDEDLKAVFTVEGEGFDVVLSLKNGRISWSSMSALGRRKSARRLSGFNSRRSSVTESSSSEGIYLSSLFSAYVKRQPKAGTDKENEGTCLGLVLSTIERKNENILREKSIFFEHPSDELCSAWSDKIKKYIKHAHKRPTTIKLFLQPFAGSKSGRVLYQKSILPLFQNADVSVDCSEVQHNEFIKQEVIHLNLEDYDCVVCMGGDGTVSQVVDAVLTRTQKEKEVDMKSGANPARCPVPIGIIPIGKTNTVAHSVMGVADPVTGALHIIHGHFQAVDVCSIATPDKFHQWGFNCQYGFAGQVLTFMKRYKALGSKRIDAAVIKALTKSKLRAYECDIEYIPADKSVKNDVPCRTGCNICWDEEIIKTNIEETTIDFVQELGPLDQSFTSSTSSIIDLPQDNPWRSLKGKYMNVGLFALPGLSDLTPQGLCRFTHLNNGTLDLVLVKEVEKKEFVRHLRRLGNTKDPFDFPFIEIHKIKQVRFRPRFPTGWNYNDHEFNEIKYQIERESQIQNKLSSPDFKSSVDIIDLSEEEEDEPEEENKKESEEPSEQPRLVGPMYRKTFREIEMEKKRKHERKKEEKIKAKEESKMISVWNIDNQIAHLLSLDIKVHHGLLKLNGLGVSPNTEFSEVRFGCLSGM
ncbi:ceramide kinase-like protein [Physella acuta]|uniref:ceramide kinase-like protein n=1 Tax=Physella acuta TaxID=109671 RepID=UPI0027DB45F4|nr:ceramide kinase-like protein [Physella acuta]XP_059171532.1 ceramide kinase-like protein [Physella acuta]XP_059171533.1 ceramide kinase-like protein [Physella acuta]XP_059171534.1 ceramide kinase-like protein [Physella acuta]XP_059171535.1 ceramide kinase-like protein [Physella acuta]